MSLYKDIETPSSFVASYWKITNITIDCIGKVVSIIISGYANKEKYLENKDSVMSFRFSYNFTQADFVKITKDSVYTLLKQEDMFEGADYI